MVRPLRVGGRGITPSGSPVVWSVAEGSRGRRWREVVRAGEGIAHSLLLETDSEHRFRHLELGTSSGLLTLHPEPDSTLHGHAVVSAGVKPVAGLPWDEDAIVVLTGSVVCVVAAAGLLRGAVEAHSTGARHAVRISPALALDVGPVGVEHEAGGRWRIGDAPALAIDAAGLPQLDGGETWELEIDRS